MENAEIGLFTVEHDEREVLVAGMLYLIHGGTAGGLLELVTATIKDWERLPKDAA